MGEIFLHGDCLVNRAAEIHQVLLHHLNGPDEQTEIDMSAIGKCDLSFFQLLCAASRSFADKGKHLEVRGPMPEAIIKQIEKFGLTAT